jgi:hypothetical protein
MAVSSDASLDEERRRRSNGVVADDDLGIERLTSAPTAEEIRRLAAVDRSWMDLTRRSCSEGMLQAAGVVHAQ